MSGLIGAWSHDNMVAAARKAQPSTTGRAGFMDGARWAIAHAPAQAQYVQALQGCQAGLRFQSERAERAEAELAQLKQGIANSQAQQQT